MRRCERFTNTNATLFCRVNTSRDQVPNIVPRNWISAPVVLILGAYNRSTLTTALPGRRCCAANRAVFRAAYPPSPPLKVGNEAVGSKTALSGPLHRSVEAAVCHPWTDFWVAKLRQLLYQQGHRLHSREPSSPGSFSTTPKQRRYWDFLQSYWSCCIHEHIICSQPCQSRLSRPP